jgi:hypothetical protein
MRHLFMSCLVLTTFAPSVMPAVADDQAECTAGIAMIKAELDKKPPQSTLTALQRALRSAERELKEAEFDECVDAVDDAKDLGSDRLWLRSTSLHGGCHWEACRQHSAS